MVLVSQYFIMDKIKGSWILHPWVSQYESRYSSHSLYFLLYLIKGWGICTDDFRALGMQVSRQFRNVGK